MAAAKKSAKAKKPTISTSKAPARSARPAVAEKASAKPSAKQKAAKKAVAKKPVAKTPVTKKPVTKKPGAKKAATKAGATAPRAGKKTSKKAPVAAKSTSGVAARRADYGAPIEVALAKQPAHLRAIHEELRKLVQEAAPDAEGALKWGMPVFTVGGTMMCAFGGGKAHVNLVLPGAEGTYSDPDGRLAGEGKTGKHLRIQRVEELPRAQVRAWLKTAAQLARAGN